MLTRKFILFAASSVLWGNTTQIDLGRQVRNIDFSSAVSTKPLKTGTALPATCARGELFLHLGAPSGSNVHACITDDTWSLQSSAVIFEGSGAVAAARNTVNLVAGYGIVNTIVDTGTKVNVQQSIDSAVVETRTSLQSGRTLVCSGIGSSVDRHRCTMNPTLARYTAGMVVYWMPDVSGSGGPVTLNIDSLGDTPIKLSDGITDPQTGDIVASSNHPIWFDGTYLRLMIPQAPSWGGDAAAIPPCNAASRGRIWTGFSGAGAKDEVVVCVKDATDSFAWQVVF